MKGKYYNRRIWTHKVAMEALFRLMWTAILAWYADRYGDHEERVVTENALIRKAEEWGRAITAKAEVRASVEELRQETTELRLLFQDFTSESWVKSKMFAFCEEYGHMIELLLQFVKAERTVNWEFHLFSVSVLVPYFFAMDRPNYARWLPVYTMDMRQLATKHPKVHQEFVNGNHAVHKWVHKYFDE